LTANSRAYCGGFSMILTGSELKVRVASGEVTIEPFLPKLVNPNSYNYRLGHLLKVPENRIQTPCDPGTWRAIRMTDRGYMLMPGMIYLGHTLERIGSASFVPLLLGRSSVGRLGLYLQASADLGQLGLIHRWTLELSCVQPIRIYPGMTIGQVSFWEPDGAIVLYNGRYLETELPTVSRFSLDGGV
jgi:dCTP deaminase